MREKAMPGEDAATLRRGTSRPYFVPLLGAGLVETGRVWDFPSRSWLPN